MGRMIAELCMSTGWDFRSVMGMPMTTFALFVRQTQQIENERFNRLLFELCDVVLVANQPIKYQEELKKHYQKLVVNEQQRAKIDNPAMFNMEDKGQSDQAAAIVAATLKKKMQLMGLARG